MDKYYLLMAKIQALKNEREEVKCSLQVENEKEWHINEDIKELKRILSVLQSSKELLMPLKKVYIKSFLKSWGTSTLILILITGMLNPLLRLIVVSIFSLVIATVFGKLCYKEYLKYTREIRKILKNYDFEDTERELVRIERLLREVEANKELMERRIDSIYEELKEIGDEITFLEMYHCGDELDEEDEVINEPQYDNTALLRVRMKDNKVTEE